MRQATLIANASAYSGAGPSKLLWKTTYGTGSLRAPRRPAAAGRRSMRAQCAAWMKLSASSGRLIQRLRSANFQLSHSHHDQTRRTGVRTVMGLISGGLGAAIRSGLESSADVG